VNNKGQKILLWLLSWAVLAVVVIYSPIGSPELYTTNQYVIYSQGVNFEGGIPNAPKSGGFQQHETAEVGLPVYTPTSKTYAINSAVSSENLSSAKTNYSAYSSSSDATGRTGVASSGGGGGSMSSFVSGRSSQNNAISQNTGISTISLSTELNTSNPKITKPQGAGAAVDGGTDPGGDPTGPPIPVGDGFWLLLLMAGGYAFWKIKR